MQSTIRTPIILPKSIPLTLEEIFGSVKAINRPEDFKKLREVALEEHIIKVSFDIRVQP